MPQAEARCSIGVGIGIEWKENGDQYHHGDSYGNLISSLAMENNKRIVLLVLDGLGTATTVGTGLPCNLLELRILTN